VLKLCHIGGYYYIWSDSDNSWIPNPANTAGVNYANRVRGFEQSQPW